MTPAACPPPRTREIPTQLDCLGDAVSRLDKALADLQDRLKPVSADRAYASSVEAVAKKPDACETGGRIGRFATVVESYAVTIERLADSLEI